MDSTSTAEDSQNSKRARLAAPPGDDVDRISGLDEGVILRILELVADARDAVRTGVLSRRWLGLWTRVPALRFAASPPASTAAGAASVDEQRAAALERYVSFVNGVLARRAESDCAVVQSLAFSYTGADSARDPERLIDAAADAAQGWIRYAFQHGVKSLDVDLHLPLKRPADDDDDDDGDGDDYYYVNYEDDNHSDDDDDDDLNDYVEDDDHSDDDDEGALNNDDYVEEEDDDHRDNNDDDEGAMVIIDDELLPSPEKLESMHLALRGAIRLLLPATTMKFASLVDLSLEKTKIAAGGAPLLGRFISSTSCPSLRKLRMSKLLLPSSPNNAVLRIDAALLSELWIEDCSVRSLELRTPSLRVFHVDTCCGQVLKVSAWMLQELEFFQRGYPPRRLEVDGDWTHVRSLKLYLRTRQPSHEMDGRNTNILLLKQYSSSVTCLEVNLEDEKECKDDVDVIQNLVPHLPHVTSLTVNVSDTFERHDFGAGVASLLTRFKNLTQLSIHLPFTLYYNYNLGAGLGVECNHQDHWKSHEISMVQLQELELTGLTGTDCELWFMKVVLGGAKNLYKVAIRFNPKCWQHQGKMDVFERMLLNEGMCTSNRDTFVLNASVNLHRKM